MGMQWRIVGASLFVSMLIGCGADRAPQAEREPPARATEWREAALAEQPRLDELRERVGDDMGHAPDTTEWRVAPMHQEAHEQSAVSPGRLLQKIALELGDGDFLGAEVWEQTARVWQTDAQEAVGVVMYWGFKDDSVAGRDLRLTMSLEEDLWRPTQLEERFQCRRSVSDDLCL